jgi:PAS domain S-box-containing protein
MTPQRRRVIFMRNQQKSRGRSSNTARQLRPMGPDGLCAPESTITFTELETLLQEIPAYIFCKDDRNRLLRVNRAILEATGLREEDILGKYLHDIFPSSDAENYWRHDQEVLSTGRPKNGIVQRIIVNGGEHWVRTDKIPQKDKEGNPIGIIGISFEIEDPRVEHPPLRGPWDSLSSFQDKINQTLEKRKRPRVYPSEAMREVLNLVQQAVSDNEPVFLVGESGTGKDFWATYIHEASRRSSGPFRTLNCSAGSHDAVRVQLFGRAPRALGGPEVAEKGILDVCKAGSLLLNEIGEAELQLQAKLLDFIDTRYYSRVGGTKRINGNTRIFLSSDTDPQQLVSSGKIRKDLFYRISGLTIHLPLLRDRIEDIPILAKELLEEIALQRGFSRVPALSPQSLEALRKHHWPGNVRELRNVLERAVTVSGRNRPLEVDFENGDSGNWSYLVRFPEGESFMELTRKIKYSVVHEALRRSAGSRQGAAKLLGISRHALFRLMKNLGLSDEM